MEKLNMLVLWERRKMFNIMGIEKMKEDIERLYLLIEGLMEYLDVTCHDEPKKLHKIVFEKKTKNTL